MNLQCPQCGSENIQRARAVYEAGTSHGEVYGSRSSASTFSQTPLAARCSPPSEPNIGCAVMIVTVAVTWFLSIMFVNLVRLGLLNLGIDIAEIAHPVVSYVLSWVGLEDKLIGYTNRFMPASMLLCVLFAFIVTIFLQYKSLKKRDQIYARKSYIYDRSWICHKCGNYFWRE